MDCKLYQQPAQKNFFTFGVIRRNMDIYSFNYDNFCFGGFNADVGDKAMLDLF